MKAIQEKTLRDGRILEIRKAHPADARDLLEYIDAVSGESDNLTFGPGEFPLTEAQEEEYLRGIEASENQVYFIGSLEGLLVAAVSFNAGKKPRTMHVGEFGISVRRACWGLGVGEAMLDTLIDWARSTGIVKKIALHVRTDNEGALALYRKKGFVLEGTVRKELKIGDRYHDLHLMALFL